MYFFIAKGRNNIDISHKTSPEELMRKIQQDQMQVGEIDVGSVYIEIDNRDEIPQLLRGLQHLYRNTALRSQIFKVLIKLLPKDVDRNNGRNGMTLWSIFVLGSIRLNCGWDYDKLQEIANNHTTLRQMLGHGILDMEKRYKSYRCPGGS